VAQGKYGTPFFKSAFSTGRHLCATNMKTNIGILTSQNAVASRNLRSAPMIHMRRISSSIQSTASANASLLPSTFAQLVTISTRYLAHARLIVEMLHI
jgi:hypothetical protein